MTDYKQTIFLPVTSFPMKGNLPHKEPEILARWHRINVYERMRQQSVGREKFILHEGPPYANGHLHIGHAFTGILKDIVVRSQQMLGKDAPLVPGWDCHGLPIEWKIEEKYRASGRKKEDIPQQEFRQECRAFATHWFQVQRQEAQRWGRLGDWDHPYLTLDFKAEARIAETLLAFLQNGSLYRGYRPIMWSVVEQTALAEAEIEYRDHRSLSIYVRFPIQSSPRVDVQGASALIWTTTPWTLPANRAIAYGEKTLYALIHVTQTREDSLAIPGEKLLLAEALLSSVMSQVGVQQYEILGTFPGTDLWGTICGHCFQGYGYEFSVPLLPGEHVTTESGTGLVHTAPSHGPEDFELGQKYHLETPDLVKADGFYVENLPLFGGQHIFKVNETIQAALKHQKRLLFEEQILHSYPHSWRSKKPLIYRVTSQWFISMEKTQLRHTALDQIQQVSWFPPQARHRLESMVRDRPDWCISRQRSWGVPLPLFIHRKTQEPLRDEEVNKRILQIFADEGSDAWFNDHAQRFLGSDYSLEDYEQVTDILDVWFESGATQKFVLEDRPELSNPANLYLEGSDQHRGWFQSSLLVGCGTTGRAPYKSVVTHGFVLDEKGYKMSKSLGNVVSPETIIQEKGADILRLWVACSDYREDCRVGPEILKHQEDIYRRFRNTLRYLLGGLAGFSEEEKRTDLHLFPVLEQWILHRLADLDEKMRKCVQKYDFMTFFMELHAFCAVDLSSFYFDIRKDVLYCEADISSKRRAVRTVMDALLTYLMHWLAPVLCFTAEEAWLAKHPDEDASIHLSVMPSIPDAWFNPALAGAIDSLRAYRRVMTGALEKARAEGKIGSSLQAHLFVYDPQNKMESEIPLTVSLEELTIVSKVEVLRQPLPDHAYCLESLPDFGVVVAEAHGHKCARCWKYLTEVGTHSIYQDLCFRCAKVVTDFPSAGKGSTYA